MSDYIYNGGELYHYGVLGMKWGVHRAKKKGTTYTYKSFSTNRYNRKAKNATNKAKELQDTKDIAKYKQKAAKYEQRAKRSAELDKKEQRIAEQMSTGKVLATRLLLTGGIGAKNYQQYRAMGNNKVAAAGKTAIDTMFLGGIGSRVMKGIYIRQDEK